MRGGKREGGEEQRNGRSEKSEWRIKTEKVSDTVKGKYSAGTAD